MIRSSVLLFIPAALLAQSETLKVQTRLVVVPAMVNGATARPVLDLPAERFTLLDNGVPQPFTLETIGTGVAPIALIVAVQNSGISASALAKVRRIGGMIQPLITGERGCAGLVTFAETVEWRQECTADANRLSTAFARIGTGKERSGRMLDAALESIRKLSNAQGHRRVLLLISESRDRGGKTDLDTVIAAAQAAGVTIYAATYSAFRTGFVAKSEDVERPRESSKPKIDALEPNSRPGMAKTPHPNASNRVELAAGLGELTRLGNVKSTEAMARATGGAEFPFTQLTGLETAIEKLGEELHAQYVLSFSPKNPAPGYHALTVTVALPKVTVRARPGYFANAAQ